MPSTRTGRRNAGRDDTQRLPSGDSKNAFAPWVEQLLKRKAPKLVAVALANKMARIAWKLMVTGQSYAGKTAPVAMAVIV